MQRISEEQRAILGCYSGTKDEVAKEMMIAITFIEDLELREMTEELLTQIEKMGDDKFEDMVAESMVATYDEAESKKIENLQARSFDTH